MKTIISLHGQKLIDLPMFLTYVYHLGLDRLKAQTDCWEAQELLIEMLQRELWSVN